MTWCRISRQHSAASSTFVRSAGSSAGKGSGVNPHGRVLTQRPWSGQAGRYLCSAQYSAAAVGTWSDAASQWGSCPSTAAAGSGGGSRLPEEQADSTGVAQGHAQPSLLRPRAQFQPSSFTPGLVSHLTCTKAQNRGSLRCLALSCSRANDWRLQKREEIFWNHEPSAPSNCGRMQEASGRGRRRWGCQNILGQKWKPKVGHTGLGPRALGYVRTGQDRTDSQCLEPCGAPHPGQ